LAPGGARAARPVALTCGPSEPEASATETRPSLTLFEVALNVRIVRRDLRRAALLPRHRPAQTGPQARGPPRCPWRSRPAPGPTIRSRAAPGTPGRACADAPTIPAGPTGHDGAADTTPGPRRRCRTPAPGPPP